MLRCNLTANCISRGNVTPRIKTDQADKLLILKLALRIVQRGGKNTYRFVFFFLFRFVCCIYLFLFGRGWGVVVGVLLLLLLFVCSFVCFCFVRFWGVLFLFALSFLFCCCLFAVVCCVVVLLFFVREVVVLFWGLFCQLGTDLGGWGGGEGEHTRRRKEAVGGRGGRVGGALDVNRKEQHVCAHLRRDPFAP